MEDDIPPVHASLGFPVKTSREQVRRFRLMDLPLEIRYMVYDCVLGEERAIHLQSDRLPALLKTSPQVFYEAIQMRDIEIRIDFEATPLQSIDDASQVMRWLSSANAVPRNRIRVQIEHFIWDHPRHGCSYFCCQRQTHILMPFLEALRTTKLKRPTTWSNFEQSLSFQWSFGDDLPSDSYDPERGPEALDYMIILALNARRRHLSGDELKNRVFRFMFSRHYGNPLRWNALPFFFNDTSAECVHCRFAREQTSQLPWKASN